MRPASVSFFGETHHENYPMWSPEWELGLINRVELADGEREMVMRGNAERLFGF